MLLSFKKKILVLLTNHADIAMRHIRDSVPTIEKSYQVFSTIKWRETIHNHLYGDIVKRQLRCHKNKRATAERQGKCLLYLICCVMVNALFLNDDVSAAIPLLQSS